MKTIKINILAILLLLTVVVGCKKDDSSSITQPNTIENTQPNNRTDHLLELDHPCLLTNVPVIVAQHDTLGWVNMYPYGDLGVIIDLTNMPPNTNLVHFAVDSIKKTGNLAPGQFPIHIPNPERREYIFYFGYGPGQLKMDFDCKLYYYAHFEVGNETGWAGKIARDDNDLIGKRKKHNNEIAQWYYYSYLNCCN